MEIHIKLDLPEELTQRLGIDDETVVESYIDNDSLHINIYAGEAESAIFSYATWTAPAVHSMKNRK